MSNLIMGGGAGLLLRRRTMAAFAGIGKLPTDYILVLDGSKYMLYDHKDPSDEYPQEISFSNNDDVSCNVAPMKIVVDDGFGGYVRYDYSYAYDIGNIGDNVRDTYNNTYHQTPGGCIDYGNGIGTPDGFRMTRWYHNNTDKYFYRIMHRNISGKYYLYYYRNHYAGHENEYRYLSGGSASEPLNSTSVTPPSDAPTTYKKIILNATNSTKIYRPVQRREVMRAAVEQFITTLKEKNGNHRVAMVAFSDELDDTSANVGSASEKHKTKIILGFTQVNSGTSTSIFTNAINNQMGCRGAGRIDLGMQKASILLATDNADYPATNRQKVVIVFSTGGITNYPAAQTYANTIKGSTYNGKIYTVSMMDSGAANLHALSSGNDYQSNFSYTATQPNLSTLFSNIAKET